MSYEIERIEMLDRVRAWYGALLPPDSWMHDNHTHWAVYDENATVVGFCSAAYWPELETVFLSAAGVFPAHRGYGLQKKMIDVRVKWAQRLGAKFVVTYTAVDNYSSTYNLLDKLFKAKWLPRRKWNFFYRELEGGTKLSEKLRRKLVRRMLG